MKTHRSRRKTQTIRRKIKEYASDRKLLIWEQGDFTATDQRNDANETQEEWNRHLLPIDEAADAADEQDDHHGDVALAFSHADDHSVVGNTNDLADDPGAE